MNCNIVIDLLPLYVDGLCSEETAKEIKSHLESCESCRATVEKMQKKTDFPPIKDGKSEEVKPFKKLNRKLRKSKAFVIALSAVIVVSVGFLGFLTFGEIVKYADGISFSTIFQNIEVKNRINSLLKGNVEEYIGTVSDTYLLSLYDVNYYEERKQIDTENLRNAYDKYIKGNNVVITKIGSCYLSAYNSQSHLILTETVIRFSDGSEMTIQTVKGIDGLYSDSVIEIILKDDSLREFEKALNNANLNVSQLCAMNQFSEKTMISEKGNGTFFSIRFAESEGETYHDEFLKRFAEVKALAEIERCTLAMPIYDFENKRFSSEIFLTVKDKSNGKSAVVSKKFYYNSEMDWAYENEPVEIIDGGIAPKTVNALKNLF